MGLVLLALLAGPADAQRLTNVGPRYGAHTGYFPDGAGWLAGPQLFWPVSSIVDVYPSFDYFFRPSGSAWALNLDLKAHSPARDLSWYLGTGLGYYRSSSEGATLTATGLNLFTGLEGVSGHTLPFLEVRLTVNNGGAGYRIGGGLNWH